MELAREIEETQRQQSSTLQHIVTRLRALELTPSSKSSGGSARQTHSVSGQTSDEPWDTASAEALMQTYEAHRADEATQPSPETPHAAGWFGHPFDEVTQRIKKTLHTLKPGSTIALLEERLDQFQHHINLALEDVVRRADLDGLRRIEEHVSDLGEQLYMLERHVQRLDGLEDNVRTVMEQVSDERLAKLLDYNARFAADLDAVAVRAAEEVHARFGQERDDAGARRHEELTALIEASIQDRRQAETQASSMVANLSGQVTQQADRYGEIKALLEETRREQRESEQTALGMLDTLQQALVRVLDRMDVLEQQHVAPSQPAPPQFAPPQFASGRHAAPAAYESDAMPLAMDAGEAEALQSAFAPQQRFGSFASAADTSDRGLDYAPADTTLPADDDFVAAPAEVPAAFAPARDFTPSSDDMSNGGTGEDGASTIDRLRRDFVADARRAKLKAAANRAEAKAEQQALPTRRAEVAQTADTGAASRSHVGGGGRLFGSSPKLLAGVLALVVAINGGLLLLTRSDNSAPAVPEIHVPAADATAHGAGEGAGDGEENVPAPGERSSLDDTNGNFADYHDGARGFSTDHMVTPYGDLDDVLNPPQVAPSGDTAAAPLGTTIVSAAATQHDEGIANIYEQQMLASRSRQLGTIAAQRTPDAMLPEKSGRIVNPVETAALDQTPSVGEQAAGSNGLDLPPVTVGPLSLRIAAANGDASAEFEVAARLAEGKGTSQNYGEAARWYQRSATKGFAQSQYRLGTLYERGLGVGKDLARARIWYGRAAEQGNVKAMHNLAVLAAGNESAPDYPAALRWFTAAAEHGLADSQFNLGVILENGLGGPVDRVAAYKWYMLAAKSGDADAKRLGEALKANMSAEERGNAERLVTSFQARVPNRLANDALAAGEDWKRRAGGNG